MAFHYSSNRLNTLRSLLMFFLSCLLSKFMGFFKKNQLENVMTGAQAFLVWVFPTIMFSLGFKAHLHCAKYNLRTPSWKWKRHSPWLSCSWDTLPDVFYMKKPLQPFLLANTQWSIQFTFLYSLCRQDVKYLWVQRRICDLGSVCL